MHCNDHICRTWISYYIEYNNVHCMNEMKNHRFLCGIILLKIISFSSLANCILCYFRNAKMSFEITRNKKISECIYASINFIYLTYFTKTFTSSEKPWGMICLKGASCFWNGSLKTIFRSFTYKDKYNILHTHTKWVHQRRYYNKQTIGRKKQCHIDSFKQT